MTTSAAWPVTVFNGTSTKYQATFSASAVPAAVTYDPAAQTQDQQGVDVTVTNTSTTTWSAGQVDLRARWLAPSGSDAASAVVEGPTVALGSDLAPGQARTLRALVPPPALADGVSRADYRLRFDLHDSVGNAFFTEKGNPPLDTAPALTRSWPYGDG